jgi:hypothetical protein
VRSPSYIQKKNVKVFLAGLFFLRKLNVLQKNLFKLFENCMRWNFKVRMILPLPWMKKYEILWEKYYKNVKTFSVFVDNFPTLVKRSKSLEKPHNVKLKFRKLWFCKYFISSDYKKTKNIWGKILFWEFYGFLRIFRRFLEVF